MYDVAALGELLIDFIQNGKSEQGNLLFEANPGGANRLEFADGKDNGPDPAPDGEGFMNIPDGMDDELPFR